MKLFELFDNRQGVAEGSIKMTPQQRKAHEHNLDAAQREMDHRESQGEDMTGARIDPKTYKIIKPKQGVAEGSGNWYVRVKGKVLKDKKFDAIPFPSQESARLKAMEIHNKKRIPLDMIKLTQSWMDGPDTQGVAEGKTPEREAYEQGGSDAWYHRGFAPEHHGYEPGTPEYREYKRGYDLNDAGPSGGKQYVEELSVPAAVKGAGKVIGKKLPLVAIPLGAYDAYERAKAGDIAGAGLAAGSMIGGIPHPLTIGASLGLDAIQALRDKARTGEYLPDYEKIAAAVAKDQAKQTATPADKWSDVPTDQWQAKDDKSDVIVHSPIKIGTEDEEDEALIDKGLKEQSELDRIRYYIKYTG